MRASEKAYVTLRNDIMNGELKPGRVLAEVEQAERIGVSRTPVREAMSRLLAEGLAEPNPGRGVIVSAVSMDNVYALFELRESLDATAAGLAAKKGDPQIFEQLAEDFANALTDLEIGRKDLSSYYDIVERLDREIDEAANNQYIVQAQMTLRTHLTRIRKLSKTNPDRLVKAAREHEQIARAIASQRPELAEAATRIHLSNALRAIEDASRRPDHELFTTAA